MKKTYCYAGKGDTYSYVSKDKSVVCFMLKGRRIIGLVPVLSNDIKAIRTFQCDIIHLLIKVWKEKRIDPTWNRKKSWMNNYDYYIENGIVYIYCCGSLIGKFKLFTDNTLFIEYFLENVMYALERFRNPKKNIK